MDEVSQLSSTKCIVLAVSLAAESNIEALHSLTPLRSDVFDPELVLRILLTYLPESLDPDRYTTYVGEVATRIYLEQRKNVSVDCSTVLSISESQAQRQLRKLHLLPLAQPTVPDEVKKDLLTTFLLHRAHRIDAATGLLPLVYQLIRTFINRSDDLKGWFVSTILPLLRLDYQYHSWNTAVMSLDVFESLDGATGVCKLLEKTQQAFRSGTATSATVGRDLRGIVAPWVYGRNQRKKRRLSSTFPPLSASISGSAEEHFRKQSISTEITGKYRDWGHVFKWIVSEAVSNFFLAVAAVEGWDGPTDVDFGGYVQSYEFSQKEQNLELELVRQYCQAALASVYVAEQEDFESVEGAYAILVRLAKLLDFKPPLNLATGVDLLPKIDRHSEALEEKPRSMLGLEALLLPDHPLTIPKLESYSLLQMFVYSAYLLHGVGHDTSIRNIAKLRFWGDEMEQNRLVHKVLHDLVNGPDRNETQWAYTRKTLLWLRDWGLTEVEDDLNDGYGVLGKIPKDALEKQLLRALCKVGLFNLAVELYVEPASSESPLAAEETEKIILDVAMNYYDNASNGNKTRGELKKCADIISAFGKYFHSSSGFRRSRALLAATHSLSFYSLKLQHGVPFKPVNIRAHDDPIMLISRLLNQNPKSYTKLEDLVDIGRNLSVAVVSEHPEKLVSQQVDAEEMLQLRTAERRVIGMAIEAALAEDDFETAYSYVVNRLSVPTGVSENSSAEAADDLSWRAAYHAGSHRTSTHLNQYAAKGAPQVRHLEQRLELLSHSLLLAPHAALPEILAVWRRCEEELLTLLARETADEGDFDDRADVRDVHVPGVFTGDEPKFVTQPVRKELGRAAVEEAPMGLFDVARGAAAAFSRSTGSFRDKPSSGLPTTHTLSSWPQSIGEVEGRVRKRDMVASAVTGGLASGLGWVLGATPVHE